MSSVDAAGTDEQMGWRASGQCGAVAAGGAVAVAAGIELLAAGGNAADAAASTLLALAVTDFGFYAIGGEVPLIIHDAGKGVTKVLSGVGRSPLEAAATEWYMANGIPTDGSIKAAPVPGAMHLCVTAIKEFGLRSFAEAVRPTLAMLDAGGKEWYPLLAATIRKMIDTEHSHNGTREEKLQAAVERFYRGDIADDLEAWYTTGGSFLRKVDLAAHYTAVEDPVTVNYRGYTVCKCDTWTQGPSLCQMLRLLEGFDLKAMGRLSSDYIHVIVEAIKLGLADRDEYYGDPAFVDVPLAGLLSDEYTVIRRELIDMAHASAEIRPGDPITMRAVRGPGQYRPGRGGTTTCVVADRWGNVVAATPSCNVFGDKGGEGGATGVTHGNRLRSLNTCEGHPNCIQPGKRPRITLTPTLVLKDGRCAAAISVAGGDLQDQASLTVLLNFIEFGMSPAEAVTAPRFSTFHHENSFKPCAVRAEAREELCSLHAHVGINEKVLAELTSRGHKVTTTDGPIATPVMLQVDAERGMIHAAGDPTAGRHAAALDREQA